MTYDEWKKETKETITVINTLIDDIFVQLKGIRNTMSEVEDWKTSVGSSGQKSFSKYLDKAVEELGAFENGNYDNIIEAVRNGVFY